MGNIKTLALILIIIGGLNWGLVGLFEYDVITEIFGAASVITQILYVLIGLSALYLALTSLKLIKK